jgi:hypothetical protein
MYLFELIINIDFFRKAESARRVEPEKSPGKQSMQKVINLQMKFWKKICQH